MVCALPPAVSAYIAWFGEKYLAGAVVSLVIGFVVCIEFGIKRFHADPDEEQNEN